MKKIKDGMKVKIYGTRRIWNKYNNGQPPYYAENPPIISNKVTDIYQNHGTCIVTNAHFEPEDGLVCDLLTSTGDKLVGFASWELKRALF